MVRPTLPHIAEARAENLLPERERERERGREREKERRERGGREEIGDEEGVRGGWDEDVETRRGLWAGPLYLFFLGDSQMMIQEDESGLSLSFSLHFFFSLFLCLSSSRTRRSLSLSDLSDEGPLSFLSPLSPLKVEVVFLGGEMRRERERGGGGERRGGDWEGRLGPDNAFLHTHTHTHTHTALWLKVSQHQQWSCSEECGLETVSKEHNKDQRGHKKTSISQRASKSRAKWDAAIHPRLQIVSCEEHRSYLLPERSRNKLPWDLLKAESI